MITIDDVSVSVRGTSVLEHCTATIPAGTVTALAGANGSGKTTLIRAIAGLQRHLGSIRFDGADVAQVRGQLYVCFDDAPVLPYLNGYENIRMLVGRVPSRESIEAIAPSIADPAMLRMKARRLSHGQRKRLHLVAAIASGARYLIFDEALNGVDDDTIAEFTTVLRTVAERSTVLVTGHHQSAYGSLWGSRLQLVDGELRSSDELLHGASA